MMEKLWAPWRVPYVTKIIKESKSDLFLSIARDKKNDAKHFVFLHRLDARPLAMRDFYITPAK